MNTPEDHLSESNEVVTIYLPESTVDLFRSLTNKYGYTYEFFIEQLIISNTNLLKELNGID